MWDPQSPRPRTPILLEHWISEGVFTFSPVRNNGLSLPSARSLLAEESLSPLSNREGKFVIIPLQTPPKALPGNVLKPMLDSGSDSSGSPSFRTPTVNSDHGTQVFRRSPEKRLFSPGPICRICHEGDVEEALLSPCSCSGSMELVHRSCLEKWLSTSNTDHCELCMKRLPLRKETRPLWQWFSMTNSSDGPQGFYADLTCVLLLTPLCLLSIYLCALGATDYMKHGIWEGIGLAALSCFLLGTYLAWCYITIRFHWKTVQKWKSANQVVHLVEKECRRKDRRISDSTTLRSIVITNNGWNEFNSPLQVQVFLANTSPEHQTLPIDNSVENQPNVMDASLRGFNVPAFL